MSTSKRAPLSLWTLYDHPRDFPDCFVARRFELDRPTSHVMTAPTLEALRNAMQHLGLVRIERSPEDDAKIIEVWL
jgi:hypothetical protein